MGKIRIILGAFIALMALIQFAPQHAKAAPVAIGAARAADVTTPVVEKAYYYGRRYYRRRYRRSYYYRPRYYRPRYYRPYRRYYRRRFFVY